MNTIIIGKLELVNEELDKYMDWKESKEYCKGLGDGWRLPTMEELISLIDSSQSNPDLPEKTKLKPKSGYYWSSIPYGRGFTSIIWTISLDDGISGADFKTFSNYVLPVRCVQ